MMPRTIIIAAVLAAMLATPAWTQTTTFRDNMGRQIGTATRNGDTTVFRDNMGRQTGSARRNGDRIIYRDNMGREIGSSTTDRR